MQRIYKTLHSQTLNGFYLVADTAFPCGGAAFHQGGFICMPMKAGKTLHLIEEGMHAAIQFNNQLLSCQQAAKWGMQMIQGSFGQL